MTHAEKCPVCEGKGKVNDTSVPEGAETCHGCDGKGWITVEDQGQCPHWRYEYPNWPWTEGNYTLKYEGQETETSAEETRKEYYPFLEPIESGRT